MVARLAIALLSVATVSAFTVHQHSKQRECVDLQCPATAMDYGVKHLVNEETMRSDQCTNCEQCTASGYSVCLRLDPSSRASRSSAGTCSCAHSVPANCHNQLHKEGHPANITMKLYNICYMSALQAPPRPLAVNEKASVIVTVEAFWFEPYWRDLTVENVTLHYDFTVQVPEHCDGDVITSETERAEHMCKNSLEIRIDESEENLEYADAKIHPVIETDGEKIYDQYDDELPPEVQFDRDVFAGAKLLKVYYTVDVRRPRQIHDKTASDPFRDITTQLESEVLKFDLKPEVFGTGIPELPPVNEFPDTSEPLDTHIADEDVSSEVVPGTNFFLEDTKDTKSEEAQEKEEEEIEEKAEKEDEKEEEVKDKSVQEWKDEYLEVEEKGINNKDDKITEEEEELAQKVFDDLVTSTDEGDSVEKEEDTDSVEADTEENEHEETGDEETTEGEEDTEKETEDENVEKDTEEGESTENETDEKEHEEDGDTEGEDEEGSGDMLDEEEESFLSSIVRDQYHLARWVFGITISLCMLIILCTCLYRRGLCCCKSSESKTVSNGYRYNNANRGTELVSQPEKERLHQ